MWQVQYIVGRLLKLKDDRQRVGEKIKETTEAIEKDRERASVEILEEEKQLENGDREHL